MPLTRIKNLIPKTALPSTLLLPLLMHTEVWWAKHPGLLTGYTSSGPVSAPSQITVRSRNCNADAVEHTALSLGMLLSRAQPAYNAIWEQASPWPPSLKLTALSLPRP